MSLPVQSKFGMLNPHPSFKNQPFRPLAGLTFARREARPQLQLCPCGSQKTLNDPFGAMPVGSTPWVVGQP